MTSFNRITLIGNITKDPELRQTTSGISATSFSLAVNEKLKDGTEEVTFVNCVAYDKKAELICRYIKKGYPLFVEGKLKSRTWTDKNNNKRTEWEVLVNEIVFLSSSNTSQGAQTSAQGSNYTPSAYGGTQAKFEDVPNDDTLPF
jgi:single-strand DNA-binding protein